jgi:hypothetical protein
MSTYESIKEERVSKQNERETQGPIIRYVAKKRLIKMEENEKKRKIKEEKDHEKLIHILAATKPQSLIVQMKGKNGTILNNALPKNSGDYQKTSTKMMPSSLKLRTDDENTKYPISSVQKDKEYPKKTKSDGRKILGRLDLNVNINNQQQKDKIQYKRVESLIKEENILDLDDIFVSLKDAPDSYSTTNLIGSESSDDPLLTAKKTKVSPREKIWMKREEFIEKIISNSASRHA